MPWAAAGISGPARSIGLNIVFSPVLKVSDFASDFPENRVPLFGPMLWAQPPTATYSVSIEEAWSSWSKP